ncbi:ATP-binding cassette domain-containing protein [Oscillospiraceae bacterium HV4-5-C5C]|nr:ATP-binding cassette domain-containing protein [Oscillospiraceae bacterium HV4-5-C5C]
MAEDIIRVENLHKSFVSHNKSTEVLQGIDLSVKAGEIYGIIGKSGAGKSTLVRCINYLVKPSSGKVLFEGTDLGELGSRELNQVRHQMAMIFQQFNLLMQRNALKNICYPLEITRVPKEQAKQRAMELLKLVGMETRANAYPAELSGGQKQRIAIARALASNPKVLLCDEATSALDPETTKSILELLRDINHKLGITIVVITHEMAVIEELCSKVAIISDGKIAESGDMAQIFMHPQSEAARQLIFPNRKSIPEMRSRRYCRIVFDGRSSFEPVVANMVLDFGQAVNIMFADTRNLDGMAVGQMVIQLPDNPEVALRMIAYLRDKQISVEEVSDHA